uniref:Fas ligand (TNF superfamily, member 6) n=1 Tax=Takifugu rubripes TaxID=31033 RepID=H2VDK4_TAKRU
MSCDQTYPFPQVFLVDAGGSQHPDQPPGLVPCWSHPPSLESAGRRQKSRGSMGVSPCTALVVLMLFLLVFAGLGFEAYEIYQMKKELRQVRWCDGHLSFSGLYEPLLKDEDDRERPAAHVIGRIEKEKFSKTLRWESRVGRAFTSGGVSYQFQDGALQVNETGIYHIYSRVELVFRDCSPTSSFHHLVFVRRGGRPSPLTLMEAHRAGFCRQQSAHPWTAESYLASALQLQTHDRVYVNVSHPTFLSHTHYANFFGLYKI